MGDANCHLHSGLRGQLLDRCISLLPKGLRVVLVGQARNVPFLRVREEDEHTGFCMLCLQLHGQGVLAQYLEKPGKDIGGLAPDHKKTRVELPEAGVQVLKALQ